MNAVLSPCGLYRYLLERDVQMCGQVILYAGINASTAGDVSDDPTSRKWIGFTKVYGGRRYVAINPFAYRSKDVRILAHVADPVGPENAAYIAQAIALADVLVPCWGSREKIPRTLWPYLDDLLSRFLHSGKPVKTFGLTRSGDPKHPLMLSYSTPLVDWSRAP